MAFNLKTGKTVWQTSRETIRGWSTPVVFRAPTTKELILNGHSKVVSYDIATGDVCGSALPVWGRVLNAGSDRRDGHAIQADQEQWSPSDPVAPVMSQANKKPGSATHRRP